MDVLLAMGFDVSTAERALQLNQGDVERSLDALLTGKVKPLDTQQVKMTTVPSSTKIGLSSDEVIVNDISQFSFDSMGSSSCTPIALQFAAIFLRALNDEGTTPNTYELMTEATLEGISSYSAIVGDSISAYSTVHLSVEEYLAQAPQVAALLKNTGGPYQRLLTDINSFHSMLEQAISEAMCSSSLCTYIAVTVTKPPETVVVFLPVDRNRSDCASNRSYYIFDSHSRPQLNIEGSYVAKCSSETNLINRLKLLFPPLDSEGEDNYMMWMYNSFEGTAFALPDELISALAHNIGNSGGEHVTTSAITEEEEVVERSESAINSPPQNHTSSSEVDVNDDEYVIV